MFRLLSLLTLLALTIPGSSALRAVPVHADSSSAALRVSVADAVQIGMEKSRRLEIARLDRQMSAEKVREAWSPVLPQISTGVTYTRSLKSSILFFPSGMFSSTSGADATGFTPINISPDNSGKATVDVRQSLFNGTALAGIRAAGIVRKISEEAYRDAEAEVVSTIRMAYFDALISRAELQLVRDSIDRWEEARRDTRAMYRQGVAADIDTLKATLSVENLRPDLIQAESRVSNTLTRLRNAMGLDPSVALVLTDSLSVAGTAYPADAQAAWHEALDARPDVRQLELRVRAEREQLSAARAERYPMLTAFGELASQTAFNDDTDLGSSAWPVSSSIGLQLSLPIFTGYRISAKVEQAKIARFQAMTRLEDLRANVLAEVEVRLSNLREARRRIDVQSKTIAMAERSYRISLLRFREGVGSRLELTDAELQLNKARTNYLQAVYDCLRAEVELDRSLGRTPVPAPAS
ncbi:TolC family protein [Chlorobium sp. N1]|uniref:TolC family protein n=1 Tax=Chlorobium sp. N1 TaxID=2491138 RepID=UPI00103F8B15|nr:TolC family protein [Chlorobium sp. N1]TCD47306.1 TolC family protein [Chlorobium sp. N1]